VEAPEGILCSNSHQWVLQTNDNVCVGLTHKILEKIGDVISIELPESNTTFLKNDVFATVESVRLALELLAPVEGEIVEVNDILINSPELLNDDPYNTWIVKIRPVDFIKDSFDLIEYDDYIESF